MPGPAADPPRPESPQAALDAIEQNLRTGRLPHAVLALQGVDASARLSFDGLLERLEAQGYVDEVEVLRLCFGQPSIVRSLRSARVASIGLALFVAGVLGLFGGGPLVLVPALAVLYVAGELMRVLLFRPILRSMSPAERRLVQGLLDVSTFHSDDTTVTQFGGWLFAGMGAAVLFGAMLMRDRGEWLAVSIIGFVGTTLLVAGVLAARSARRMAQSPVFVRSLRNRPRQSGRPQNARSDRRFATFAIIAVGFFGLLASLLLTAVVTSEPSQTVDVGSLPAERTYYGFVRSNGEPGQLYVKCPALLAALTADPDPVCDQQVRDIRRLSLVFFIVVVVIVVIQVLLVRRRRELSRSLAAMSPGTSSTGRWGR